MNTALANPKALASAGSNGDLFAWFPLPEDVGAAGSCTFHVEVLSDAGAGTAAMSLHFFDINWGHLEPDAPNRDQCDGKSPGTLSWSCPVTTSGIHYVVVDGNEGIDVDVVVTAAPL